MCAMHCTRADCIADSCVYDAENDADSDGICGDFDSCEYDVENDADSDVICADIDSCPYDHTNDEDGNKVCQNFDNCYPNPCKNGQCINARSDSLDGGFSCKCDSGWQGTLCDKDI